MMKKMKRLYALALVVCSPLLYIQGQTTAKDTVLTREMVLEKEYNPTIRDASRINTLPEVKDPVTSKAVIEYSNYTYPFRTKPYIVPLKANELFTSVKESNQRGYLKAGVGTNLNIDGDAGYQILNTPDDQLNVFFSHRSANSKVSYLQSDESQRMKINDNWGGFTFAHRFEPFTLLADAKYTYAGFNYYGYTLTPPATLTPPLPEIDKTLNQVNHMLDVNVGVDSRGESEINYLVHFNFSRFSQKYSIYEPLKGPKETVGTLDWDVNWDFDGGNIFGIAGYFRGINATVSQPVSGYYYEGYDDYSQLAINPYLAMSDDSWKLRLGAKMHYFLDHGGEVFSIAPDIAFSAYPSSSSEAYLKVGGGINSNTNQTVFYQNRYASPQYRIQDSKSVVDAVIGLKNCIQRNFWLDIFAGYEVMQNEHFFLPAYPVNSISSAYNRIIAGNVPVPDYMDAKRFKAAIHAKYAYQDILELALKAQYNGWNVKYASDAPQVTDQPKAWNKPVFEWDFSAAYTFAFPLRLDLSYHLETGRKTYMQEVVKMKNINELNLTATYTLNKMVSVFGRLNNILFQEYDLWYGYPGQGASLFLGVNVKF